MRFQDSYYDSVYQKTQLWKCLRVSLTFILSMLSWQVIHSEPSPVTERIIALGNTADLPVKTDFYQNLRSTIGELRTPTFIIINGDFTDGSMDFYTDSLRVTQLISTIEDLDYASLIFIPGDRDWANSGIKGWDYVQKLEQLVESFKLPNLYWPIKEGCPGPKAIPIGEHVLLITIQTQWWNHPYEKPTPGNGDCKIADKGDFKEELEDLIDENDHKNILIAGHYPFISYGPYGGKWPYHKYLFPVPVVSGMIHSFRSNIGTVKDIVNHRIDELNKELKQIFLERNQIIYLSGHEHNLQVLKFEDHYLINSGSPFKRDYSGSGPLAIYAESTRGFIELRYYENGQVESVIRSSNDNKFLELQKIGLYRSNCEVGSVQITANLRNIQCQEHQDKSKPKSDLQNTVTLAAGKEYQASKTKQAWLGKHYRKSWVTPITVPYLNMDTTFGGLTPYQKGGGRQTLSLKFKSANENEYVFRSVNKDPTKALDYEYRSTIIGEVVKDQTSAQQPYGALVVDKLLDTLEILHASPRLYVLPGNEYMGAFQEYSGLLGMLEDRPVNPKKVRTPFAQADKILKSYEMFRSLYDDHDNKVEVAEFARARAFDLLVGDWGKHEDNWKWAGYGNTRKMIYRPIPRDRDHVFSLWDGILPWLADREWAKPSAANFGYDYKGIRSLMWQARHLDRFVASELDREDWLNAAGYIQNRLNQQKIEESVRSLPVEVYEIDGEVICEKLNSRLNNLDQAVSAYYDLLAKEVDIVGSNKREAFQVYRHEDGSVEVTLHDLKGDSGIDSTRLYYHRKFLPGETKEIRLFGLQKADYFRVTGEAKKSIPVRIIGGPGADRIEDESMVGGIGKKTMIYENNGNNQIELGKEGRLVRHLDHKVYNYDRTAFEYNRYSPLIFISSSRDFGVGFKGGVAFTNQKFAKPDYSAKHDFNFAFSSEKINVFGYQGRFRHVLGRWDLLLESLAADSYYFTYFFGLGNDSEKQTDLFEEDYYRTTYNSYQFTAGLGHEIWEENNSQISFKLHYENNEGQIGENTILKDPEFTQEVIGIDDTNILEAVIDLDLDFRDHRSFPEKGMRAFLQHRSGIVSSNDNRGYGVIQGTLEGFISAYPNRPITLGLKVGGSKSYGEVPFYKLKYLGQSNDLRGYLRNRFTGTSTLFVNSELRWEISEFNTSFLPIRVGVKAFFDTGRIYSTYDLTNNWHLGYGGGVYLIPLKKEVAINMSLAFSEEESALFLLGIGKAF